jgi:hypothetical protein
MTPRFTLDRKYPALLLPALALTLSACPDDPIEPSSGTDSETETDTDTSTTEPTSTDPTSTTTTTTDPTIDPSTTTTTETTFEPTTDPSTTTTTDPSTTTTTDTSTGTTADDTSTGTTADDTTTGTTTDTDTDTDTDTTTGDVFELSKVWVASNPGGLATDKLIGFDPALANPLGSVIPVGDVGSIESIAVTSGGDGIITVDLPGLVTGGVIIDEDMANNPPAAGAIGVGQRFIRGPLTGLQTPKGVEADIPGGIFLVADTAAKDMKAFDFDDDGDVAPLFTITNLGGSPAVWDMHYASNSDTLFAAGTDGVVRIYDNFTDNDGQAGPTRSVTPFFNNAKVSVNLHGIDVVNNRLFLTDVGSAMNTTDGQVFILNSAITITGNVPVTERFTGGKLGNPVDLEVVPGILQDILYVAEKSNDALIVFTEGLLDQPYTLTGDITRTKLESVARITNNSLMLASNPAGAVDLDQALVQTPNVMNPPAASSVLNQLGSATSIQSLVLGSNAGLISFDGPLQSGGGGVFAVPDLANVAMPDVPAPIDLARLWGPNASIVAPKGIVLNDAEDTLFVADFGAADVKVFAGAALGDVAPTFTLTDLGAAPWDVAYDDVADRLYVALVNGDVLVYDDALANQGGAADRTITPTDDQATKLSVNLHGIEYDAAADLLLLSDVGSAMVATDGQLFLIADASTADGDVPVLAQVGGDATMLGNPVDIAYDGVNLYVAEKANSLVLRFDNFVALAGPNNIAASASVAVPSVESVALFFTLVP